MHIPGGILVAINLILSLVKAADVGVDVSWPMQHQQDNVASHRDYLAGCAVAYSATLCEENDADRISLNLNQPPLQTNFTHAGYAKVKAPATIFRSLQNLWKKGYPRELQKEEWDEGNIYTNHWKAPSQVLPIHDPDDEVGLSRADRQRLMEEVQDVLESWSGKELVPTSMYGIRVYTKGSILAPHVDRLPLVISAIINVAQERITEPWILEVIGHDGLAVNITMDPGDMVLYESHSIIHGRPYPLKGKAYANVFLHFEPIGYSYELERTLQRKRQQSEQDSLEQLFDRAKEQDQSKRKGERTLTKQLPGYLDEDSFESMRWLQQFIFYKEEPKKKVKKGTVTQGVTKAHKLAAEGDLTTLQKLAQTDPSSLHSQDDNGWTPLHEAARYGNTEVIEFLIAEGTNVNVRTNNGNGGTALWWAEHNLPSSHPTIEILRKHGAIAVAPGAQQDEALPDTTG